MVLMRSILRSLLKWKLAISCFGHLIASWSRRRTSISQVPGISWISVGERALFCLEFSVSFQYYRCQDKISSLRDFNMQKRDCQVFHFF